MSCLNENEEEKKSEKESQIWIRISFKVIVEVGTGGVLWRLFVWRLAATESLREETGGLNLAHRSTIFFCYMDLEIYR